MKIFLLTPKKNVVLFQFPLNILKMKEVCFISMYIDFNDVNAINMSGRSLYPRGGTTLNVGGHSALQIF
jgi:hypothetical protein